MNSPSYVACMVPDKIMASTSGKTEGSMPVSYTHLDVYKRQAQEAPEVCPVCAHAQAFFEVRAENY